MTKPLRHRFIAACSLAGAFGLSGCDMTTPAPEANTARQVLTAEITAQSLKACTHAPQDTAYAARLGKALDGVITPLLQDVSDKGITICLDARLGSQKPLKNGDIINAAYYADTRVLAVVDNGQAFVPRKNWLTQQKNPLFNVKLSPYVDQLDSTVTPVAVAKDGVFVSQSWKSGSSFRYLWSNLAQRPDVKAADGWLATPPVTLAKTTFSLTVTPSPAR